MVLFNPKALWMHPRSAIERRYKNTQRMIAFELTMCIVLVIMTVICLI